MAIWWNSSPGTTLGVEWELQLIDATSKLLRQDAREACACIGVTRSATTTQSKNRDVRI